MHHVVHSELTCFVKDEHMATIRERFVGNVRDGWEGSFAWVLVYFLRPDKSWKEGVREVEFHGFQVPWRLVGTSEPLTSFLG